MSSRWERQQVRQPELAQGVDADLVRANRKRYKLAFGLLGFGLVLIFLNAEVHLPDVFRIIVVGAAMAAWITGIVMAKWARQEQIFLDRPDPEGPPSILRK